MQNDDETKIDKADPKWRALHLKNDFIITTARSIEHPLDGNDIVAHAEAQHEVIETTLIKLREEGLVTSRLHERIYDQLAYGTELPNQADGKSLEDAYKAAHTLARAVTTAQKLTARNDLIGAISWGLHAKDRESDDPSIEKVVSGIEETIGRFRNAAAQSL